MTEKFTLPGFDELTLRAVRNARDRFGRPGITRQECVMDLMLLTADQASFLLLWAGQDPNEQVTASARLKDNFQNPDDET